jgi:hypothetical protein
MVPMHSLLLLFLAATLPTAGSLNARTNLYYLETSDLGQSWQTVRGEKLTPPLTSHQHTALVHNYRAANRLVYLKGINFDANGRPVILYRKSASFAPGPMRRTVEDAARVLDFLAGRDERNPVTIGRPAVDSVAALHLPTAFTRGGTLPAGLTIPGRPFSAAQLYGLGFRHEPSTHHHRAPSSTPTLY